MDFASYQRPTLPPDLVVKDLSKSVTEGPQKEPKPDERVICINRGRKDITVTFDSRHMVLPPGYFEIEYEAAKHFRNREIVPGTKNPELNTFVSWIAILNVDADEKCQPFTDEELLEFGEKVEAIDRSALTSPADRDVQLRSVRQVQASSQSFSSGARIKPKGGGIDASVQATPAAMEAAAAVLDKPGMTASREAEAEARSEGVAPVAQRVRR